MVARCGFSLTNLRSGDMRPTTGKTLKNLFFPALLFLLVCAMATFVVHTRARPQWQQKVDEWVLDGTETGEEVEFMLVLQEQADLGRIDARASKAERGTAVYELLTETALRSQPAVIAELVEAGADYRPYWISNMIWVRGNGALVESLARRPDVARIFANPAVKLDLVTLPLLDQTVSEGFFTHSFENNSSNNYYFEIHSDWARGNKEMLMVSIIFDQQINSEIEQNVNVLCTEFLEKLLSNEEIYTAFYINDINNFEALIFIEA